MTSAADTAPSPAPDESAHESALAALRGEIDRLDDQIHDLVMRRAEVVATLANSRVKGGASPLRPGREAMILRRLLARHAGALPGGAVVRLWRGDFWAPRAPPGGVPPPPLSRGGREAPPPRGPFRGGPPPP